MDGFSNKQRFGAHLLIAGWGEPRGKHADADTDIAFLDDNIIRLCVLQEILQHGHSFEVEKILSDERYQILKVSG